LKIKVGKSNPDAPEEKDAFYEQHHYLQLTCLGTNSK